MSSFKVGDRVRVIAGPRTGEVTTVTALHTLLPEHTFVNYWTAAGFPVGSVLCELDLPSTMVPGYRISSPPAWLETYRDDANEPAETVEAWIADLCKSKESA